VLALSQSPATADTGGPVAVMGIDAEDGGVGGHGPISVYDTIVSNLFANVTNGGSGILVLGGGKVPGDDVTEFYDQVEADTGKTVTYANGAALDTQTFDGFGLVIVVSSQDETSSGGLTDAESESLKMRAPDFAKHVNLGGGLISFSQSGQTSPYGFLGDVGTFQRVSIDGDDTNIDVTAAGATAGLTDDLDVCCWHDQYADFPAFLSVLATYANPEGLTPGVAAVGGAKVLIPTGIDLTPPTQQVTLGGACAVTATVTEGGQPILGKNVDFSVSAGPRAGTTGAGVTDANGQVTFSYPAPTAGADTIGATYTDSIGRLREATPVTCTAVATEVLGEVVTPAPAPAPQPVVAAPRFTG
jgi:hypothetical protein